MPAYASLAVHFDPSRNAPVEARRIIDGALRGWPPRAALERGAGTRLVTIPCRYGGADGPDLEELARHAGLESDEVVRRHVACTFQVAMLGFQPGFPYLLGLDPALAMTRLASRRPRVPAGSVGIGGAQAGVYPDAGPGGWRLVGRTPLRLFDAQRDPPSLLAPGDRVRFVPIDGRRFSASEATREKRIPIAAAVHGIEVLSPGLQTSVQDLGRVGHRHLGVGSAGALDGYSARVANLLVGNAGDAALLEIALQGPRLRFTRAARSALAGADIDAQVDGVAVPGWRPLDVPAGSALVLGACRRGARAYLACAGGVQVEPVLGSAATDLRGGFGGVAGRCLVAGDVIGRREAAAVGALAIAPWWIDPTPDLDLDQARPLRILAGRDAVVPADALCGRAWRVTAQSNRQGLRLQGDALAPSDVGERVSEPVAPGTVQLPPDGQPIVLLGEAQTVGGYPRIGHVIAADLPRLAQRRPGDALAFAAVDAATAHAAACAQRQRLARIALAIGQRRGR